MLQFLEALKSADVFRDQDIAGVRTLPAIPPRFATALPGGLHKEVVAALHGLGIERLYEHQAQAIEAIESGRDVAIISPTASGKTLCFNLPVVSELRANKGLHALYVYPMKALANDQLLALKAITKQLKPPHAVSAWTFDGDTEQDTRKLLKAEPPNIIITNPDSLHYAMLAYSEHWLKFFQSLRFIVLDEAHEYRGFFGINVAYVVRRLLSLCRSLGASPQIIVSSATVANPLEHAHALTGREFVLVTGEHAGRCLRHMVFVNPDYRDFQYERLLLRKLSLLTATCVESNVSALIFCPTRKFVERIHKLAKAELRERELDAEAVAPYKAGYTAEERREIERGLKAGDILVVFSTNALEIGIDMGRLDLVVMVGFPDTVMSAWQRAGRAGRSLDKEALVIYLASRNAIDQFYVNNIDLFLNKPLDRLSVNLANEEVLMGHAQCAVFELQGDKARLDPAIVGPWLADVAKKSNPDMSLLRIVRPHRSMSLRSMLGQTYTIKSKDDKEIGFTSGDKLFSEVYMGAIYEHFGRSWRVVAHGAGEILVEDNTKEHYTNPVRFSFIQPTSRLEDGRRWLSPDLEATIILGQVEVTDNLTGYREYDERTGELVAQETYSTASVSRFRTDACWLQFKFSNDVPSDQQFLQIHSVEHALRAVVPLVVPCDPYDFAGVSHRVGLAGLPTVFLYDTVKGGIGIAEQVFKDLPELAVSAHRLADGCRCENSCPRCIQIPRCFTYNEQLDRKEAIKLISGLEVLFGHLPETLNVQEMSWLSQEPPARE
jgi:DEAD/DEAH box helicase domain-containing protein